MNGTVVWLCLLTARANDACIRTTAGFVSVKPRNFTVVPARGTGTRTHAQAVVFAFVWALAPAAAAFAVADEDSSPWDRGDRGGEGHVICCRQTAQGLSCFVAWKLMGNRRNGGM